jgi:hypothetical protein
VWTRGHTVRYVLLFAPTELIEDVATALANVEPSRPQ